MLLLPWNRSVPLTWRRIAIIVFHPPVHGSVQTVLSSDEGNAQSRTREAVT
jgi:hypothetical protein